MHETRMSRREFLATTAASAATGVIFSQQTAQCDGHEARHRHLTGIPTGFQQIDKLTGGLHRTELVLLAARPGIGKTALALGFTDFVSVEADVPTLYFSLGTNKLEIARLLMCSRGEVPHSAMRHHRLPPDVGQRLTRAAAAHHLGHMYVDDQPLRTVADIRSLAKQLNGRLASDRRLGLLVVDHLQRVEGEYTGQSLDEHLIDVTYELRTVGQELNVAILALMQLACPRATSLDRRPALAELRGTQYGADVVMLLHRPGSELAVSDACEAGLDSRAQLSIIRRTDPFSETVQLVWNSDCTTFSEA